MADDAVGRQVLVRLGNGCALFVSFRFVVDIRITQKRRQAERAQVGRRITRGVLVELVDQVMEVILDGHDWLSARHAAPTAAPTQRALADKAGITQATLVALELGRATPRIQTMDKIARALEIDPMEIAEFNRAIEGPLDAAS